MRSMLTKARAGVLLLGALAVAACDDTDDDTTAPAVQTAQLRVLHASPDAPNVDVLLDGTLALSNVPFRTASSYLAVPAGTRNLRVRAAGTSTVVIDQNAATVAGRSYTVLATGRAASLAPLVLEDDLTAPAAGSVKLRVVHAAPAAGAVDVYVTAPTADLATATPTLGNVAFRAASGYLTVPAGTYRVRVVPAGTKTVAIDVNAVTLTSGQIRTAVAVDAVGGGAPLGVLLLPDAG